MSNEKAAAILAETDGLKVLKVGTVGHMIACSAVEKCIEQQASTIAALKERLAGALNSLEEIRDYDGGSVYAKDVIGRMADKAIRALASQPAAPVQPVDVVERAARAMAIHSGWNNWDTATDCTHTLSGNDPDDERDYFRGLARVALAAAPVPASEAAKQPKMGEVVYVRQIDLDSYPSRGRGFIASHTCEDDWNVPMHLAAPAAPTDAKPDYDGISKKLQAWRDGAGSAELGANYGPMGDEFAQDVIALIAAYKKQKRDAAQSVRDAAQPAKAEGGDQ